MRRLSPALLLLGLYGATSCGWDATGPTSLTPAGTGTDATLVGAGDIARCGSAGTDATANLLDRFPGTVFTVGDNAYPSGGQDDFRNCYEPSWGRQKARTRPSPGNHDYEAAGAGPYFSYFGTAAGPPGVGYYRYRLGAWQIYSLNSNVPMGSGSPQVEWLRAELAANPSNCTLAYWHHPLFSSGPHGDNPAVRVLWRVLYDARAEIVVSAHDHLYERFAPQDPDGRLDPALGIRQFVVGTGGAELTPPAIAHANSDARWTSYGVLQLTLREDSYTWTFLTDTGAAADVGGALCHSPSR